MLALEWPIGAHSLGTTGLVFNGSLGPKTTREQERPPSTAASSIITLSHIQSTGYNMSSNTHATLFINRQKTMIICIQTLQAKHSHAFMVFKLTLAESLPSAGAGDR